MKASATDSEWMDKAIGLALKGAGRTRPNPPVGAVVVRNGRAVGTGFHRRAGSAHAEVRALKEAGRRARGATLYVTLEPCCTQGRTPACTDAILAAGVKRAVISVRDPNPAHRGKGIRILRRAGIKVVENVCGIEGAELIAPFAKWITTGLPFVTLKLGMTLDGKIADMRGESKWITSAESRRVVNELRRRADAVLVGSGTACMDDPCLLPRGRDAEGKVRVIADSSGRLRLDARVLNDGRPERTLIATTRQCPGSRAKRYARKGAEVLRLPLDGKRVSLRKLMAVLGKRGILHVVCEGGGGLAEGLVKRGLVDEYLFFVAPRILGGRAISAIGGAGWRLDGAPELQFREIALIGRDLAIRAVPADR